jgi:hypothetical protein
MDEINRPAQPTPGPSPAEQLVKQLCDNVARSSTWMKLLGVLLIIYGVFLLITVVGILICWLPIWLGIILFKAAGDAESAYRGAPQMLFSYVQRMNRFFLIEGILALVGLVFALIAFFVIGMAALWGSLGLFH